MRKYVMLFLEHFDLRDMIWNAFWTNTNIIYGYLKIFSINLIGVPEAAN